MTEVSQQAAAARAKMLFESPSMHELEREFLVDRKASRSTTSSGRKDSESSVYVRSTPSAVMQRSDDWRRVGRLLQQAATMPLTNGRKGQTMPDSSKSKIDKRGASSGNESTDDDQKTHRKVTLVGLIGGERSGYMLTSRSATIGEMPGTQAAGFSYPPRFQDSNLDTVLLSGVGPGGQQDGVIVDKNGSIVAYWGSFSVQVNNGGRLQNAQVFQGIPADIIAEAIEPIKRGELNTSIRSLGVDFE